MVNISYFFQKIRLSIGILYSVIIWLISGVSTSQLLHWFSDIFDDDLILTFVGDVDIIFNCCLTPNYFYDKHSSIIY